MSALRETPRKRKKREIQATTRIFFIDNSRFLTRQLAF